ncbi:MAG: ATP-dependent helicase [Verrucomicrobiia bacterium]
MLGKATINYVAELNEEQYRAVASPPGPALVLAGAGSGKTRTLIYRVAYLLENGVDPGSIMLLTFTNKAAKEMVERVTALLPSDVSRIWAGTFHSIGYRMLRQRAAHAGEPIPTVLDREDATTLLHTCIVETGLDPKSKRYPKAEVLGAILSFATNTGTAPEYVVERQHPYFYDVMEALIRVILLYGEKKEKANLLDFDDLLVKPLHLLTNDEREAAYYQNRFQFVLVDEFQDTNKIQSDFVDLLGRKHGNIMAVGDDAQSIYSWRGANYRNILDFPKRYPKATIYRIERNYRSVPQILEVANAAISRNSEQFAKRLVAVREKAPVRPTVVELQDARQQAAFVSGRIRQLLDNGVEASEIAVLYRAHFHSMEVQMELTARGIGFSVTSGLRFFEQAHVKDVAAYLRFATNPLDEVSFKRIIKLIPGIGEKNALTIWTQVSTLVQGRDRKVPLGQALSGISVPPKAAEEWRQFLHTLDELAPGSDPPSASESIKIVLEAGYNDWLRSKYPNYDARRDDLTTLADYGSGFTDRGEFLSQLSLLGGVDAGLAEQRRTDPNSVTLSSVHQAKGLEWRVVFVVWLADGMFPNARAMEESDALEEERRLFYVAVTRARDELYLSWPQMQITQQRGVSVHRPSRFVKDLPEELVETRSVLNNMFYAGARWDDPEE